MVLTCHAITPVSGFAANKIHFVLHNGNANGWVVKILRLIYKPGISTVTGALSGEWTLRRRVGTTTAPAGTGSVAIIPASTVHPAQSGITAWNSPQTAPSGGSLETFDTFLPQPDEIKASTLDAPTMASLQVFGGVTLYDATALGQEATPISLQQNETLELLQGTAGTGNCRIACVFACFG